MAQTLSLEDIREAFPTLKQEVNGRPLVYFDNAATSQKPYAVIKAIEDYYNRYNANIHRGVHHLSQLATDTYEQARILVQQHLNAKSSKEIIFTTGTTQAINLVAQTWGRANVQEGDIILVSAIEHHSNIVPWQMIATEKKAQIQVIPCNERGELIQEEYEKLLRNKPKLVAFNHVSNALGTVNPAKEMIAKAHENGAVVLVDGAQSFPHMGIDVQDLNADFYAISGHKAYAPTGSGALYGKQELLEAMPPYMGGGEMIAEVKFEGSTWADLPHKFEAGTPNIEGGIGLGAALKWMHEVGVETIAQAEEELLDYATEQLLKEIPGAKVIGTAEHKAAVLSFVIEGLHPYDVGSILDQMGIAVRTGHHCAQPVMEFFKIPGTLRASFAVYNTKAEIDLLIAGLKKAQSMLS